MTMNFQSNRSDQQGFVAIFSVLIIMGILTLLAIGFSNITRHAQRRTLDDQLNLQAFYAAETGVNRVTSLIDSDGLVMTSPTGKTECQGSQLLVDTATDSYDYDIDSTLGVRISCLLIDTTPSSYTNSAVTDETTYIQTPQASNGMIVQWDATDTGTLPNAVLNGGNPVLPTKGAWLNNIGMMRIDLVPASDLSRQSMATNGYTFFLNPTTNSGGVTTASVNSGTLAQGSTILVRCVDNASLAYRCRVTLNLIGATSTQYYMHLQSYYNPVQTDIQFTRNSTAQEISGSQALIDSTGRVGGVARRIQVAVPLPTAQNTFQGEQTPFSIMSAGSLCKIVIGIPRQSMLDPGLNPSDPACEMGN